MTDMLVYGSCGYVAVTELPKSSPVIAIMVQWSCICNIGYTSLVKYHYLALNYSSCGYVAVTELPKSSPVIAIMVQWSRICNIGYTSLVKYHYLALNKAMVV